MLTGADLMTVERALQLALAPAFVLGGIMAVLNLLNTRFQRIGDLQRAVAQDGLSRDVGTMSALKLRGRIIFSAILSCILASLLLCLLVVVSFVEPLFGVGAGLHVVGLLVLGMTLLIVGLVLFLAEMVISVRSRDLDRS